MKKIIEITSIEELMEMGMSGGGVAGHTNGSFKPKKEQKKMRKELQTEMLMRNYIRNKIKKHFCGKCAAPILTYVEKYKKYYLYAGLLDDISFLSKAENIHFKESHFPFMEISEKNIKV